MLIIALLEQHYNNLSHTRQLSPHVGPMLMENLPVRPWVGLASHAASPI
jgi:hypothetical protein